VKDRHDGCVKRVAGKRFVDTECDARIPELNELRIESDLPGCDYDVRIRVVPVALSTSLRDKRRSLILFLLNYHFLLFQLTESDSSHWLLPHGVHLIVGMC
jgi:hypothetical protein